MFQSNQQASSIQDPSKHVGPNDSCSVAVDGMQNGAHYQAERVVCTSKKYEKDIEMLGLQIKKHEANIKILKSQKNCLDDSILDMQVTLGNYHSSSSPVINDKDHKSEEETLEDIIRHEKSAASILCLLKFRHASQTPHLALCKDVLGVVAQLGKLDDDNLSRLLSEYLGIETMLAVVCKTSEGVKALETYEKDGSITKTSGIHELGISIGRQLDGRFLVICLENLRQYSGDFVANDPQMRLDLLKPRLPNGGSPPGFLGFAVNMINIDADNLSRLTATGSGLRETLFYNLFSRLQVYKTREDMLQALPCIKDGAISLDGGIIKPTGIFYLGCRANTNVKFPKGCGTSTLPANYLETEKLIKEMKWKEERIQDDIQREQALLNQAMFGFEVKKKEFVKYLEESSIQDTQHQTRQSGTD